MNLTAISIRRPSLIVACFLVLVIMGVSSYLRLPIELTPKYSPPIATVATLYPGAGPSEVENTVSKPLENALASMEGVDNIWVTSAENASFILIEFVQDADINRMIPEAQRKINQAAAAFPREVRQPTLNKFALDELPILRLAVSSSALSGSDFFDLVNNQIAPEIAQVKGVAEVSVLGGESREIRVNVNRERLDQYGLSLLQLAQALQAANLDFPTGKVSDPESQTRIRLSGKFDNLNEIRDLVVGKTKTGSSILLGEVAEVQDGVREPEVITRSDGKPAISLSVRKQGDANAVKMADLTLAKLRDLERNYAAEGLKFDIVANSSVFTRRAAAEVVKDLALAVLLVALVMLLFLHSLRTAAIVMVAIPTSILSAFVAFQLLGYSLNLLSLLGLSLSIGILVDDAIVVIENIYRHLEMGKSRAQAAYDGRMEIGFTAISITLIDVVVFLPVIFTGGIVSGLLTQFCVAVLVSTLMSLLVSFTLVPWLASRFGRAHRFEGRNRAGRAVLAFERSLDGAADFFVRLMQAALRTGFSRAMALLIAAGLLFASAGLVTSGFIGNAFLEAGERGEFLIDIEMPRNATLAQTNAAVQEVEAILKRQPDVARLFTTVGANVRSNGLSQPYIAEVHVFLKPYKRPRKDNTLVYARKTKIELESRIAGPVIRTAPIDIQGLSLAPIEVILLGPEPDSLLVLSRQISQIMEATPGCIEVRPTVEAGSPELRVEPDRRRMADYGITMAQVGLTLQTAFSGNTDTRYREGGYEYPVRIMLDAFDRQNTDDLRKLTLTNPLGALISLDRFANISESPAPARLERRARRPSVTINAQVLGRTNGAVGREIKTRLDALTLPAGYEIRYGGDLRRQEQGMGDLSFALWLSVVLVYLVMAALYDNWAYPFVVLFSIPLAVVGALLALALSGKTLTVFAGLGMLMLVGLVGKNAILVVDFANQLRARDMPVVEALARATRLRFRPILMTNISMIIGLLPIALAQGSGADWKNGLAWAIIGGLSSSMLLSLVIVPVAYVIVDGLVRRLGLQKKSPPEFSTEG